MPGTLDVVVLGRILQRVGDEQVTVDQRDAKRSVAWRQSRVGERTGERGGLETRIEHVDGARPEVRGVHEYARRIRREREPFVNRAGSALAVVDL